jgi:hypothetical protein
MITRKDFPIFDDLPIGVYFNFLDTDNRRIKNGDFNLPTYKKISENQVQFSDGRISPPFWGRRKFKVYNVHY